MNFMIDEEKHFVEVYLKFKNLYNERGHLTEYEDYIFVKKIISLVMKIKDERSLIGATVESMPEGFTPLGLFVNAGICRRWWLRLFCNNQEFLNSSSKFIIYEKNAFRQKVYSGTPVIIAIENGYFDVLIDLIEAGAGKSVIYNAFYENISEELNIKHSIMFTFCAKCTCQSYHTLSQLTTIDKCLFLSIKISLLKHMSCILNSTLVNEISTDCWRIIFLDMIVRDDLQFFIYLISIGFDLNKFGDRILHCLTIGSVCAYDHHLLRFSSKFDTVLSIRECYININKNFNKIVELIFYSGYDYTYEELLQLTDNSYENGLMELKLKPISLQNICRRTIRRCIRIYGHNMKNAINCLSIMPGIKPFLHMKDLISYIV